MGYAVHHRVLTAVVHKDDGAGQQLGKVEAQSGAHTPSKALRKPRDIQLEAAPPQRLCEDRAGFTGREGAVAEVGNDRIPANHSCFGRHPPERTRENDGRAVREGLH